MALAFPQVSITNKVTGDKDVISQVCITIYRRSVGRPRGGNGVSVVWVAARFDHTCPGLDDPDNKAGGGRKSRTQEVGPATSPRCADSEDNPTISGKHRHQDKGLRAPPSRLLPRLASRRPRPVRGAS